MRLVTNMTDFIGTQLSHMPPPAYNPEMAKLGFLGLGIMGGPMARNLLRAGHEVALWSYSAGKAEQLAGESKTATVCSTPAEVAARSECVFLCVGDTKMSADVI